MNISDIDNYKNQLILLPSEIKEDLEHYLINLDLSYDFILNAFEYLGDDGVKLNSSINKFAKSINQEDKRIAIEEIVKTFSK